MLKSLRNKFIIIINSNLTKVIQGGKIILVKNNS